MAGRIFAVLITVAATAHAQSVAMVDSPPSLTWRAPAECPDLDSVRARVEQRIERSIDGAVRGIEVDVALAAGRYIARVDLRAVTVANDVRTLNAKRCSELADAVAVIVARVASEAIAKQRVAVRDEADASTTKLVDLPPPVQAKPRVWTLGARVSAVNGIGVIPKVGVAGEGAITLRRKNTMIELSYTRWFDSAAQHHDGGPPKVDVVLDSVCARYGWRPTALPLRAWAAFEWGYMSGTERKLPDQLQEGRWLAAGAGFGIAWQMKPWIRLFGANETMVAFDRLRFTNGSGAVVYAPSPMSFRTIVGLEAGWQ